MLSVMGTASTQLQPIPARLESNPVLTNPISQEKLGCRCVYKTLQFKKPWCKSNKHISRPHKIRGPPSCHVIAQEL